MAKKNQRMVCLCVVCALVILGLLIAVIVLATREDEDCKTDKQKSLPISGPSLLQQYSVGDGLMITWSNNFKTASKKEGIRILNVEVAKVKDEFFSRGEQLGLLLILDDLNSYSDIVLNIRLEANFQNTDVAAELIGEIRRRKFNNPVIITLPVLSSTFDWQQFFMHKNFHNDIMVSFDVTAQCCDAGIGRGTMEYINILFNKADISGFVEVDVRNLLTSWEDIKWLLNQNKKLVLIISGNSADDNSTLYDMLTVRNDIDKNRVMYNLEEATRKEFLYVASTAGSSLLYFDITPRDAGDIIWSHNTDTWEQINKATTGDVMMIEGDIMLLGQNTPNQTELPIMAHDVGDNNNLTFEQWLDEIIKVEKGMKFDFKSLDAVKPALKIVQTKRDLIKGPIWLNADILQGPSAKPTRIPANDFLDAIAEFPEATLSLGWTTVSKKENYNLKYTMAMVQEMQNICKTLKQPITFPVRAEQLVDSWNEFDWLLNQSRRYTLTVWTSPVDNVTKSDMDYIKQQAEVARVYFDLPENLRPSF